MLDLTPKEAIKLLNYMLCLDDIRNNVNYCDAINTAINCLRKIASSEYAPVVHAHWEYDKDGIDWGLGAYLCSNCHTRNNNLPANTKINPLAFAGSHYCPQCGAKMDGEQCEKE